MTSASQFDWQIENAARVARKATGGAEMSQLVWLPSWVSWKAAEDDDTPELIDSYMDDALADVIEEGLVDYDSDAEYQTGDETELLQADAETRGARNDSMELITETSEELRMILNWDRPVSYIQYSSSG